MTALFDNKEAAPFAIDPNKDYLAELVGEGKKFKTTADLARSVVEKEVHINRLETEGRELREDLGKRATLDEVLATIRKNEQVSKPLPDPEEILGKGVNANLVTPEDLNKLIQEKVSETINHARAETVGDNNINAVVAKLKETWGDDYVAVLSEKTKELGVSKDWITDIAKAQPKALLTLLGVADGPAKKQPAPNVFNPTTVGINTAGLSANKHSDGKNYAYYSQMRREKPDLYHSVPVTRERHAQAQKLGAAFYE